ncbi:helix-turn-helix domain-containing protein [Longimicrobium sp.]|uniref:helix-turn-helix domain-containing protein n=1 Tax=Longimicrobium sp. TaxID=2029185 RepID=UPI002E342265|nr:DDE-type integrase/transposase/recombinase [Longimicrobium sp.]HEX6037320.1 DDE-type integrase/transposase/recombinase [Longimicrobium sp.]
MPWLETNAMEERMRFIVAHEQGLYSMTELCERHGISRQAGYDVLKRYQAEGIEGLKDRSHAPRHCPHKISPEVAEALLQLRRRKPDWGPKTLLGRLAIDRPDLQLPAASTVGDLLAREGLVKPRRKRARPAVSTGGAVRTSRPNEVWSADYKGQFRTLDGKYCYPLTIQDSHTRFVLTINALRSTSTKEAQPSFEQAFREYGLPEAIWTDNGTPFAAPTPLRLTRLNAWWIRLGITPQRSRPGCPQDNGRHERMHRKLTPSRFPPGETQAAQQLKFDAIREELDYERPHHALDLRTPADVYVPSQRAMPERIPGPEYAAHHEVRRVRRVGTIRFRGHEIFVSEVLVNESLALEEVADGVWSVFFYHVMLARFSERDGKLHP